MTNGHHAPCPYCGAKIVPGTPTCSTCGAPVQTLSGEPVSTPSAFGQPGPAQGFGQPPGQAAQQGQLGGPSGAPFGSATPFGSSPPSGSSQTWSAAASTVGVRRMSRGLGASLGSLVTFLIIGAVVYYNTSGASCSRSCGGGPPVPIALNTPVQGQLTPFHSRQFYRLELTSPATVQIAVVGGFDNYLELFMGDSTTPMLTDDDSGGNLNARINATLPAGVYRILVRPFSEGRGSYTLTVMGIPMPGSPMPGLPMPGSPMPGSPMPGTM